MIPAGVTDTPRRRDMSVTDELLQNNEHYATAFDQGDLQLPPAKKLAVLACMDARVIPSRILGLDVGDAHIRLRDADLYRR
jgi:carbonic anhydrase